MLKKNVLRDKKDFSRLFKNGRSLGGKYVVFFYRKNGLPYNRRAFLASKKVGKSVQRNRARRLIRENYRFLEPELPLGYDVLFIARNTIIGASCQEVGKSMNAVIKKSGLLK